MLQKLFLCLNNSYMMYVECLDVLFGKNFSKCERFKDLDFKPQEWRFCGQLCLFESMRFWGLVYTTKLLAFSLKMASLFIEEVWEDERVCFTRCQHSGLVEMKQLSYVKNRCSNAWYKHGLKLLEAFRHVAYSFGIVYVQRKQLRGSRSWKLHKVCFMWMEMVPLCHK